MFVSIYRRSARVVKLDTVLSPDSPIKQMVLAHRIYPSALNIVNVADSYQELFFSLQSFSTGKVEIYDLNRNEKVGTMYPSGRIMLQFEYIGGYTPEPEPLPIHRTEAGYPRCSTCDGGGCPDCTDSAY